MALEFFGGAKPAEAAKTQSETTPKHTTTENIVLKNERRLMTANMIAVEMFLKGCTPEGKVPILEDLYGYKIQQEKTKIDSQTTEYRRGIDPETSKILLQTKIGELIKNSPATEKYKDANTMTDAQNIIERVREHYGKTPRGKAMEKFFALTQSTFFPAGGFGSEPGILYGTDDKKMFIPASSLTNGEILEIIAGAMVASGVDQEIAKEKNLNERSGMAKSAIYSALELVTKGATQSVAAGGGGSAETYTGEFLSPQGK